MKKLLMATVLIIIILLPGCSKLDSVLEQTILEQSGILEEESYQVYLEYQEAGKLDEEGHYADPTLVRDEDAEVEEEVRDGQIHVTFGENHFLEICYYSDAKMTVPIDTDGCYMNSGDVLYAKVISCKNPNSNLYCLAEYRIVEYDSEGNIRNRFTQEIEDGILCYKIPENFTGTELAVLPIGEYPDREIKTFVYHVDDNGMEEELFGAGVWTINDEDIGEVAQISPIEPYVLNFEYDTVNYFYVGCEPECFTKDPATTGIVEFWEVEPTDEVVEYRIELCKFMELSLKFSEEATISVNQGEAERVKKNKVFKLEGLRYGDSITIETAGECMITDGDYRHIEAGKDPIIGGYRYTLKVVRTAQSSTADELTLTVDVDRSFTVNLETECDHGVCTYKLDGEIVSGEIAVQEGQTLTATYRITEDGYCFAEQSEGISGFFHDLFNADERTGEIPITAELDGTTFDADEWFDVVEEEG